MPTLKIDPKVIFASDAPAIDKPPVFSDKTKGWDVARANDGRPQIKEMNKVQQDTDLKILWLNENAVLPYDASIDYPDGAVTIKDDSFKQLSSGSWVEFLDDFADKDAVKRGIANRYDSSLTYNSGERVALTNGDIVKSTIDSNTNDPNVNMTGWVYSSLTPSNNLNDVVNKAAARTNLDVYSKAETNSIAATPSATETVAGKARIATQSETIAGTNDATIITPKKLRDISFGRTGGYANVTASRSANTVYTNPKNTPLVVAITAGAQASTALNKTSIINGALEAVYASISSESMISTQIVIVPPLAQYKLNNPLSIVKWMEW